MTPSCSANYHGANAYDMWEDGAQQGVKRSLEEPTSAEMPIDQSEGRHGIGPIPPLRRDGALRRIVDGASKTLDPVTSPARCRSSPY